jgi:hypothetical protein
MGLLVKHKKESEANATTRICPACLEPVAKAATRCKFCTSQLDPGL